MCTTATNKIVPKIVLCGFVNTPVLPLRTTFVLSLADSFLILNVSFQQNGFNSSRLSLKDNHKCLTKDLYARQEEVRVTYCINASQTYNKMWSWACKRECQSRGFRCLPNPNTEADSTNRAHDTSFSFHYRAPYSKLSTVYRTRVSTKIVKVALLTIGLSATECIERVPGVWES